MNRIAKLPKLPCCLLVGLLLISVTGLSEMTGHDHGRSDYCRICSSVQVVDVPVSGERADPPRHPGVAAPDVDTAAEVDADLLVATPLRGPPGFSG